MVDNNSHLPGYSKIPVPCGKCYACKMRTVSQWAFRLRKEEEVSSSSLFVTLTYDTNHVPISPNGFMTLDKTDLQKWFKRLRKLQKDVKIKYMAVGEYGGKTLRPHYHVILFNAKKENVFTTWSVDGDDIGSVHIGNVTGASIAYTLKYMMKDGKIPMFKRDDRQKEFRLMSKGMGANYLTENIKIWHRQDLTRLYTVIEDGIKVALPRYYREKIWNDAERLNQNVMIIQKLEKKQDENEKKFNRERPNEDYRKHRLEVADRKTVRSFKKSSERKDL